MSENNHTRRALRTALRGREFHRLYILAMLFAYCTLFYYFGELVDYAGWEELRWSFLYSVHDIHRLFYVAPIIYAAHAFGLRAAIIITIVSAGTWIPRALFFSPYPDPVLRMVLAIIIEGVIGVLTAISIRESRRARRLEREVRSERDKLKDVMELMDDGVIITGPDYKIRFLNNSMIKIFGEGQGAFCYQYLYESEKPCKEICRVDEVIKGAVVRWQHQFQDGSNYEIVASPFVDSDGQVCQLATFRRIKV